MTETNRDTVDLSKLPYADDEGRSLPGILSRAGSVDPELLVDAMAEASRTGGSVADAALAIGAASEHDLQNALARKHRVMVLTRGKVPPDPALAHLLPLDFCLRNAVLPWMRIGKTIVVAGPDPSAFADLTQQIDPSLGQVMFALAPEAEIYDALADSHSERLVEQAEYKVPIEESCRDINEVTPKRAILAAALALCAIWLLASSPLLFFAAVLGLAMVSLAFNQLLKVAAAVATLWPRAPKAQRPVFRTAMPLVSVLVPLFREEQIADTLVARLKALKYPKSRLDVVLVLEAADDLTKATLARTKLPPWIRVIEVPEGTVLTKPRALNYALNFCRGELVGIYDAEDAPAPDQIDRVAAFFRSAPQEVACVQGILDFYNPRANWLARCFAIEYATWFRVILPGLARLNFALPLGGTTLFIRRRVLEEVHGWDAHNVTEDADLGIRLARYGYRTVPLPTVTQEEANNRFWPWVKQRSRWLKGYMVTYFVHMRRPVRLLRDLGLWKFLGFQILFLATLLQFALAPLLWSFWIVLLGVPHPLADQIGENTAAMILALFITSEAIALGTCCLAIARSPHERLFPWVPTMMFYFPLGVLAVYKALFELVAKPFYWDKTTHGLSTPDPQSDS